MVGPNHHLLAPMVLTCVQVTKFHVHHILQHLVPAWGPVIFCTATYHSPQERTSDVWTKGGTKFNSRYGRQIFIQHAFHYKTVFDSALAGFGSLRSCTVARSRPTLSQAKSKKQRTKERSWRNQGFEAPAALNSTARVPPQTCPKLKCETRGRYTKTSQECACYSHCSDLGWPLGSTKDMGYMTARIQTRASYHCTILPAIKSRWQLAQRTHAHRV